MARFLSREWIAEADEVAAASPQLAQATASAELVVQQVVTGGPDGEVAYVVSLDRGSVGLRPGLTETPDVTLTVDWDTAVAMSTGALGAQEAFTTGRLQVRGEIGLMLRHGTALTGLNAVFAGLRDRTTY